MRTLAKVLGAALIAVALIHPTLGRDLYSSMSARFTVGPAVAHQRAGAQPARNGQAPNYLTKSQEDQAAAAPVGTFGYKLGASHFKQLNPGARWSQCAPVRFVLNTEHAPAGAAGDFRLALHKIAQATGLTMRVVGTTTATPTAAWADTPAADGGWRPVMVSWGRYGDGILEKGAAATSAPHFEVNAAGQKVYTSGQVTFNVATDRAYSPGFGQMGSRVSMDMHELGHIVGLDHVHDPNQLMYPTVYVADAGAGDLAGLALMGHGGCRQIPAP